MKDFKFTKEERDSIEDFALDQVLERNFGGIENVTDYIESLIQARADADDWVNIDPTKADQIPDINCWILTIGGDIEFCPEGCFVPFNYASHYKTIPIPSPPKTESK